MPQTPHWIQLCGPLAPLLLSGTRCEWADTSRLRAFTRARRLPVSHLGLFMVFTPQLASRAKIGIVIVAPPSSLLVFSVHHHKAQTLRISVQHDLVKS